MHTAVFKGKLFFIQTVVVLEGFKMGSSCCNVLISPVALNVVSIRPYPLPVICACTSLVLVHLRYFLLGILQVCELGIRSNIGIRFQVILVGIKSAFST